jgi:REP element-mobilizing transposase RayT
VTDSGVATSPATPEGLSILWGRLATCAPIGNRRKLVLATSPSLDPPVMGRHQTVENVGSRRPLNCGVRFPRSSVAALSLRRPTHLPHLALVRQPSREPQFLFDDHVRSAFVAMDRVLDSACTSPLYLRRPEIATMTVEAIRYRHEHMGHYQLHSYVVMANHVHLLITPFVEVPRVMQSLKRFTAKAANRMLGQTGQPFWQDESYDRLVRDQEEFRRITRYIEMNPVNAGLSARPEDFPWSSAGPINNRSAGFQPAPQAS